MNPKGQRSCRLIILILSLFSFLRPKLSFAQQSPFTPQENAMFIILNQLQEKEAAIRDSMEEAQMRLMKSSLKEKRVEKVREGLVLFKALLSRTHPYLTESVSFYDNMDSQKDFKKSSIVNNFTPGLKMNFRDRAKSLRLDFYINTSLYNNRRRSNRQSAGSEAVTTFNIRRYMLTISDSYFSNYVASEEFGVDDHDFDKYWQNSISSTIGRHFNRIGFDLGYKQTILENELLLKDSDSIQETVNFNQYLRIATKTQLLFAYNYNRAKYTHRIDPDDSQSKNFNLSLAGVLSSKLTALIETAYVLTDQKTGDDSRGITLNGKLGHQISRRSNLALTLSRSINESATKANYYIGNSFNLSGNHRLAFNPKFNLSFNSGASYGRYPKKADFTQKNETYTLGLGLSYAFRQWLDFSLDWAHTKSESNVSIDYSANTFTFKTQAKF